MKKPLEPASGSGRKEMLFPVTGSNLSSATGFLQGFPGEGTRPLPISCPSSQVHGHASRIQDVEPRLLSYSETQMDACRSTDTNAWTAF